MISPLFVAAIRRHAACQEHCSAFRNDLQNHKQKEKGEQRSTYDSKCPEFRHYKSNANDAAKQDWKPKQAAQQSVKLSHC